MVKVLKTEEKQSFSVFIERQISNVDKGEEPKQYEFRFLPNKLNEAQMSSDGKTWISVSEAGAAIQAFNEKYVLELEELIESEEVD